MGSQWSVKYQANKMYKVVFAVVVVVASLVIAQDYEDDVGNGLAAGNEEILTNPYDPESYSCEGQAYGYYADVNTGCEVFHICMPIEDNEGEIIEYAKWSSSVAIKQSSTNRPLPATISRMH